MGSLAKKTGWLVRLVNGWPRFQASSPAFVWRLLKPGMERNSSRKKGMSCGEMYTCVCGYGWHYFYFFKLGSLKGSSLRKSEIYNQLIQGSKLTSVPPKLRISFRVRRLASTTRSGCSIVVIIAPRGSASVHHPRLLPLYI